MEKKVLRLYVDFECYPVKFTRACWQSCNLITNNGLSSSLEGKQIYI